MKKKLLTVAGAATLALSMSFAAMADVVTSDVDYGTEGTATTNDSAWNSAANGQFAIENNQKLTFTFDSKSADTTNAVYGWVAEVTDGNSYFTITQGGTGWFAPAGCEWVSNTNNVFEIEKSWSDDDAATYAEAMGDAKVVLTVTRADNQFIFESTATGSDGVEYTQTATAVFETAPEGTLNLQVGSDHGSMVLYSVKYDEAGEVEVKEIETTELKTLKANLHPDDGLSSTTKANDDDSDSPMGTIIIVIVVVLVIAVVVAIVVSSKKKKTN
jgi:hypothetical protein